MSDMAGGKATAVCDWAAAEGHACLLLDYAGCGLSDGLFADQTLLDWRGDVLDLIDAKAEGPVVIVGSSMGGWLMLRSEEHTSELQSLMRISYAVFCLKKKKQTQHQQWNINTKTK